MSSREIAELTGKRHANVIRDIREMLTGLGITELTFESSYIDPTGRALSALLQPPERPDHHSGLWLQRPDALRHHQALDGTGGTASAGPANHLR